jgi:hypothetical protein
MKRIVTIIISCLLLLSILIACESGRDAIGPQEIPPEDDGDEHGYSAEDTLEAQILSCWFTGELLATDSLFSELLYSINYLRHVHGDSCSVLNKNRFMAPWRIGELIVGFDAVTADQVRNHQYTGWDSLAEHLRPDSILEYPDRLGIALLGFDELYNPRRLADSYQELPGVRYSEPNAIGFITEATFPIFPGWIDEEMSYVFVHGFLYLASRYSYFKYINTEPQYIGTYDILANEPAPDWWPEAQSNIENFYTWDGP